MKGHSLRFLSLLALLPLGGCADTVQPYLGGLKVGVTGGSYQMPMLLNETLPFRYPPDAWRNRVGGETLLYIHITTEGAVDSVMVLQTDGQEHDRRRHPSSTRHPELLALGFHSPRATAGTKAERSAVRRSIVRSSSALL